MDQAIEKQIQENLRQDKRRAKLFEEMLETDAWCMYQELLLKACEARSGGLLNPIDGIGGVLLQEYNKGALYGIQFALDIPKLTIAVISQARAEQGDENDDGDEN